MYDKIHYKKKFLFIYFLLCWVWVALHGLFSSCNKQGLLTLVECGFLLVVDSLVAEHRF